MRPDAWLVPVMRPWLTQAFLAGSEYLAEAIRLEVVAEGIGYRCLVAELAAGRDDEADN